jgi:hypothetical protein
MEEGIYLFFDNEITEEESSIPFEVIDLPSFEKEFKNEYTRFKNEHANYGVDEQDADLRPLSERKFIEYCDKAKSVLFIYIRSLTELELVLPEDAEMTDITRDIISREGLLFVAEMIGDVNFFWTGASIRRWFRTRFPVKPKEPRYAKPPTVIDLLYEFLESVANSRDNLLALKETLLILSAEDRLFVEDILKGKNPKNSKKAQDTSARILHALKDRMLKS